MLVMMLIFSEFGVKVKSEIPQPVRLLLPRDTAKGQAADLLCAGLGSFGCQMVIFNIIPDVYVATLNLIMVGSSMKNTTKS